MKVNLLESKELIGGGSILLDFMGPPHSPIYILNKLYKYQFINQVNPQNHGITKWTCEKLKTPTILNDFTVYDMYMVWRHKTTSYLLNNTVVIFMYCLSARCIWKSTIFICNIVNVSHGKYLPSTSNVVHVYFYL